MRQGDSPRDRARLQSDALARLRRQRERLLLSDQAWSREHLPFLRGALVLEGMSDAELVTRFEALGEDGAALLADQRGQLRSETAHFSDLAALLRRAERRLARLTEQPLGPEIASTRGLLAGGPTLDLLTGEAPT